MATKEIVLEENIDSSTEKRKKPSIDSNVDKPFEQDYDVRSESEINEQKHGHAVEDFKNRVSSKIVFWGIIIIVGITIVEVFIAKNYDALEKTFEFVKTMVTMSLGFLLADSKKR